MVQLNTSTTYTERASEQSKTVSAQLAGSSSASVCPKGRCVARWGWSCDIPTRNIPTHVITRHYTAIGINWSHNYFTINNYPVRACAAGLCVWSRQFVYNVYL